MNLHEILHQTLKSALHQSVHSDLYSPRHIALDDELLLRWESDELSEQELLEVTTHLEHCPECFTQIGEMLRTGVLELPERLAPSKKAVEQRGKPWKTWLRAGVAVLLVALVSFGVWRLSVGTKDEIASMMIEYSISDPDDTPMDGQPLQSLNTQQQNLVIQDGGVVSYPPSNSISIMIQNKKDPASTTGTIPLPPPLSDGDFKPRENAIKVQTNETKTIFLYEQRLGGELQPIDPKKWSAFGSINGFLKSIVVFEKPGPSAKNTFRWTMDENEAQWVLILQKSPIGFTLKRKGRYSTEDTGIDQILLKGFNVFSDEPRPALLGNVEEF